MQALPFHPNTQTHDHNTGTKNNGKHAFAKNCVRFDIPRIVNDCPNCIIDKINTHILQGFTGYIKAHFLQSYQDNCYIVDCYLCKK